MHATIRSQQQAFLKAPKDEATDFGSTRRNKLARVVGTKALLLPCPILRKYFSETFPFITFSLNSILESKFRKKYQKNKLPLP